MTELDIIVAEIADNFNRGTDFQFKKRIESLAVGFRATIYRREYDRNGRFPVGSMATLLVDVEAINTKTDPVCSDKHLCKYRTSIRIPRPIRAKMTSPFTYVGETDGNHAFGYSNLATMKLNESVRFIDGRGSYDYINGRLYLKDVAGSQVLLKYVPEDWRDILELQECDEATCVDGNFIDLDMKDTIRKMIYQELNQNPVDEEVKMNE